MENTISIIVPAYNEEKNIEDTVKTINDCITRCYEIKDYELILIDNASVDKTGEIIDALAQGNERIVPVHLYPNVGYGGAYWEGVRRAKFNYIVVVPGDNETDPRTLDNLFRRMSKADMVLSYTANPKVRPLSRQIVSRVYTVLLNFLLGLKLKYYNGVSMHRRDLLLKLLEMRKPSMGHSFNAEIIGTLLKSGYTYLEVPQYIRPREGKAKAFEIRNILRVLKTILRLFWDLRFGKKYVM